MSINIKRKGWRIEYEERIEEVEKEGLGEIRLWEYYNRISGIYCFV